MESARGTLRLNLALGALVGLGVLASLLVGPAGLGAVEAMGGLVARDAGVAALVMQEVRLPRALLGVLVGGALGLAGAALQGFLRNPLAEPGVVGVGPSAALGAVLVFYYGLADVFPLALPLGGLVGAGLAALGLEAIAGRSSGATPAILAGVAISSLAGALTALALSLAPNPFAAVEILFWLLGSLADRSMTHVWLAAPFVAVGAGLLFATARALDALSLGEEAARSMGVDLRATRLMVVGGAAASVGAATAVAGSIGFVGLIAPHLLRPLVGARPGALLAPSMLGGAALVLFADVATRLAPTDAELKLGVATALIGAPLFFWIALRPDSERV